MKNDSLPPAESTEHPHAPQGQPHESAAAAQPSLSKEGASPGADTPANEHGAAQQANPSFWQSRPLLKAESTVPPSFSSRLFGVLGYMPLVPLALMLVLQTLFSLDARELWYSDEIRHADAFRNFLQDPGFVLTMDGELYPDKPPLYFVFLWGVHAVLEHFSLLKPEGVTVYFAGAALSAFFLVLASMLLGRIVARMDGRSLLAGGIVFLCSGLMIGLMHYARMDLLFATSIVLSQIAFYHALVRQRAYMFMGCAFFFAGVACLIKGPYGLILPLLIAVIFSCWRKNPLRLLRLDALAGLVVFLAVVGVWAGGVYLETGGFDYLLNTVFKHQIVDRALNASHHKEPWHYYLVRLPLVFLPWTLAVLCVRWHRLFSRETWAGLTRSRQPEGEGLAFLWITVIVTFLVLSAVSTKIHVYFLPALPALSLLTGRALLQMAAPQAGLFRHVFALFFLLVGIGMVIFSLMLFGFLPTPETTALPQWQVPMNGSFFFVAMLFVALAATLWFGLRGNRPEGVLLLVALFTTGLGFPLANMVAPSFNAVLSPKAQALVMSTYIEAGYKPFSFKVYSGTYSYYSGYPTAPLATLHEAQEMVEAHVPFVLALRAKDLDAWVEKPQALHEVHRQWIETNEYILLAFPVSEAKGPIVKDANKDAGTDAASAPQSDGAQGEVTQGEAPERVAPQANGTMTNGTQAKGALAPSGNRTVPMPDNVSMPGPQTNSTAPEKGDLDKEAVSPAAQITAPLAAPEENTPSHTQETPVPGGQGATPAAQPGVGLPEGAVPQTPTSGNGGGTQEPQRNGTQ